jgi:hypothetical protein
VHFYASQHPSKDELILVDGIVKNIQLGGRGTVTRLEIESDNKTHLYSSYYGKVWPGLQRIKPGDEVYVLAERNKLKKNEFIDGKSYYIWELIHQGQTIIKYEDILILVNSKEAVVNQYINYWLAISSIFLIFAFLRRNIYK